MSATEPVQAKPAEEHDDCCEEVVAEIKKKSGAEQLKLIGLYKLLADVNAADSVHGDDVTRNQFASFTKIKALFGQALTIYKNEFTFSKAAIRNPEEFFTAEELADPNFEKLEAIPSENPWFTLLTKIDVINSYITEADEPILKHLTHIEVTRHADSDDFEVEFTFAPNDYFTNDKLKVEAIVDPEDEDGEPIQEIKSTEINWNEGKDPRFEEKKTKAKTKKGKKIPGKVVREKVESFFWLFKAHSKDGGDDDDEEDEGEDEDGFDPVSDEGLYGMAADILHTLSQDAFTYAIPAMFGLKVDEFTGLGGIDEEQLKGVGGQLEGGQKPECKQQ